MPDSWLRKLGLFLIALTHVLGGLVGVVLIPLGLLQVLEAYQSNKSGMLTGVLLCGLGVVILLTLFSYIGMLRRHCRLQRQLEDMGEQLAEIRRELARSRADSLS